MLFGFLSAPLVFPLVYPLRNTKLRYIKPFWYYFDDEDGFGYEVHWWTESLNKVKKSFKYAYLWCAIRNPAWNLHASLKPPKGKIKVLKQRGKLTRDGKIIDLNNFATFKYVNENGFYRDNKGKYLSIKYSTLGYSFVIFELKGRKYWRYSFAGKKLLWFEIHLGTGERHVFRFKVYLKRQTYK